jgi:flagellar FliL protein
MHVHAPEHREKLALGLAKVLEAPYSPQPEGPKISNVLFTAFVVQ